MPDLLKDMYNEATLTQFALDIKAVYEPFDVNHFLKMTMDETWIDLELKARLRQISTILGKCLPLDYPQAISILDQVVENYTGFFGIVFPDFVEVYGQDDIHLELSIQSLEKYTKHSSSEFAIRPFIINHEKRMLEQIHTWTTHENEHIRRLASEGCRPQLPWAQPLAKYKQDPTPILEILDKLKQDSSLYVKKSVANNLNDISKTHPELITNLAKEWYGHNDDTNWIVKHGCRTLLKKGNRDVLAIFGYHDASSICVNDFQQSTKSIAIGDDITFSFSIKTKEATKIRLEYGIDYVKSNGKRNRKIFQISELSLKENEEKTYCKKQGFADLSTRKHYPGIHTITLIVNGIEREQFDFLLQTKTAKK